MLALAMKNTNHTEATMPDFFDTGFVFLCDACAFGPLDPVADVAANAVCFCADCGAPLTPAALAANPVGVGPATPSFAELNAAVRATAEADAVA